MDEVAFLLRPRREGWILDGTVGLGGHAEALLATGPDVHLLGLDVDPEAVARARARLAPFGPRARVVRSSFRRLADVARAEGVEREVLSVLLDLGVSSYQLEEAGRGFSFQADEPLDMRLDPEQPLTAADVVNDTPEPELAGLLAEHGDEPHARRIAREIARRRPLSTTAELVAAVRRAVPRRAWPRRLHVATRTFQAVRMAVNDEPAALRQALPEAARLLPPGGRLAVIAFHSGEDRIVKRTFRELAVSGYAEIEPSPLGPGDDEVRANPRARSAKLRVLEREQ